MKLTTMEIQFLNGMRNNCYCDVLTAGCTWLFSAVEECPYTEKQATGVISSLMKKGLIETYFDKEDKLHIVCFTDQGKALFDTADGEECDWGGKPLLKID